MEDYELIRDRLEELNPGAITIERLDEAIVGLCRHGEAPPVALYDVRRILDILVDEGMSEEEARDYFDYAILGAFGGPMAPVYAWFE